MLSPIKDSLKLLRLTWRPNPPANQIHLATSTTCLSDPPSNKYQIHSDQFPYQIQADQIHSNQFPYQIQADQLPYQIHLADQIHQIHLDDQIHLAVRSTLSDPLYMPPDGGKMQL